MHFVGHFLSIQTGRIYRLLKRLSVQVVRGLALPFAFVAAYAYSIFSGRDFRVFLASLQHIGGWASSLDGYLRRTTAQSSVKPVTDVLIVSPDGIANPYFLQLTNNKLRVVTSRLAGAVLSPLTLVPNRFRISEFRYLEPRYKTGGTVPPTVPMFSSKDHERGSGLLRDLGIPSSAWYVGFFCRDNAYLERHADSHSISSYRKYHDCRNSDISHYVSAIKYIVANGGYAIRLGSLAEQRVPYSNPHFLDYPFSGLCSPFADVYLACHCKFIVGSGSGIVDLSSLSDVPLGMTDYSFYAEKFAARTHSIWMPKLLRFGEDGSIVTLKHYFELMGPPDQISLIRQAKVVQDLGLFYQSNTESDILEMTVALYQRFIEQTLPDDQWAHWQTGAEEARSINPACTMWEPFLRKYSGLLGV